MSAAYRSAGVTHGRRSALRLLQTDRSDGTVSPRFAPTTNMPAHNNDRIDTQSERITGDLCGTDLRSYATPNAPFLETVARFGSLATSYHGRCALWLKTFRQEHEQSLPRTVPACGAKCRRKLGRRR
jgi:hypothetical protein